MIKCENQLLSLLLAAFAHIQCCRSQSQVWNLFLRRSVTAGQILAFLAAQSLLRFRCRLEKSSLQNPLVPLSIPKCCNFQDRILPQFLGTQPSVPQHPQADPDLFPHPYPRDVALKKLFQENIVYQRTKPSKFWKDSTKAGFFNARVCDLKKLLLRVRASLKKAAETQETESVFIEELPNAMRSEDGRNTLIFESRFESGNLEMASKVGNFEYNLLMQNDVNSKGNTQWFFFRVTNAVPEVPYIFHIVNFSKPDSLFNAGMMVMVYSTWAYEVDGLGWHRDGEDIMYYPNGIYRDESEKEYHSLTFTYRFQYPEDHVYFAYSYPYTYTQLSTYLYEMELNPSKRK